MTRTSTNVNNRFDYIDITKALGMLTIIWAHIAIGKSAIVAYAFHIPLFFFLSGMVFVKNKYPTFGPFVKRRIKTLIIPYIIYSFITWAIWAGFSYATHANVESFWMPLLETFIAQGSEGYLVHNVPLWFVSCLFVIELAYFWIASLSDVWNVIVCVLLAGVGYLLVYHCDFFDFTTLPWSIEVAMMAILFYSTGNLLAKNVGHQRLTQSVKDNKWITVAILLVLFGLTYIGAMTNGKVSMGHAILHNPLLFYPTAYMGVSSVILLCILLANCPSINQKLEGVKWFGQNSLIAMVIHNPIKGFVLVALSAGLGMKTMDVKKDMFTSFIAFVITLIVTVVLMYIIVKIKTQIKKRHEHINI